MIPTGRVSTDLFEHLLNEPLDTLTGPVSHNISVNLLPISHELLFIPLQL
jgi:hypothetical protein